MLRKNGVDIWLILFYDGDYGFFLYHDTEFVPVKKGIAKADREVVEHIVGSNPMKVPSIAYRSRQEGWEIIDEFIKTGDRLNKFNWVRLSDIEFERE